MEQDLFSPSDFFSNLFNAIPSPLFVVDHDVRILYLNQSASEILGDDREGIYRKRSGDVLHCIQAAETPAGCGAAAACRDCVIRNSVNEAFQGGRVYRRKALMSLLTNKGTKKTHALVTTSPFRFEGKDFALLILEDISEILQLRSLLPICAWCKKIRNDKNYWQSLEEYFSMHLDLEFSHGLCEECCKKHYPECDP